MEQNHTNDKNIDILLAAIEAANDLRQINEVRAQAFKAYQNGDISGREYEYIVQVSEVGEAAEARATEAKAAEIKPSKRMKRLGRFTLRGIR